MSEVGEVIQGNCLEELSNMEASSVDLVVADPPYNLSHGNNMGWEDKNWNKVDEDWDSFTVDDYMSFTQNWLKECKRVLKDGGGIFTFGTYHNIGFVNVVLQHLSMDILNEIVWYKRNAFPNLSTTRLTASHEDILWAYKGDDKNYTFNYEWMKGTNWEHDSFDKNDTQVRTVWNIPTNKDESETKHGDHPTQKPLSVIDRIVKMGSNEGDVVLDPFAGSGTTLVSAKKNNRKYIGIEKEGDYVEICERRLNAVETEEEQEKGIMDY